MPPTGGYLLTPCPFCGAVALNLIASENGGTRVVCPTCDTYGPRGDTVEGAMDVWNTRRAPAQAAGPG